MHPLLNIADKAARLAGKIIMRAIMRLDSIAITNKGLNDFVTEIDKKAEAAIIETIRLAQPTHAFLAEESGETGTSDYVWIIDPIDGTSNFIHGIPMFAVSIAVQYKGVLQHAIIFAPFTGELFTASRGSGAYLNGRRIRVTKTATAKGAILGMGYPYRQPELMPQQLRIIEKLCTEVGGFRSLGSAALTLAYVAAGRLDGTWFACLKYWDIAAGLLLLQEAGGIACNYKGEEDFTEGRIIAGNPKMLKSLIKVISSVA